MDKVRVSREVAEAVENCRGLSPAFIVREIANHYYGGGSCDLRTQSLAELLLSSETELDQAVQVAFGYYKVEQTPQDKIKELFEKNLDMYDQAKENGLDGDAMFRDGRSDGILRTLEILNIKVPGVNE